MPATQCKDVGDANPEIAGIGILLSFTIQGFISFVASVYCFYQRRRIEQVADHLHQQENSVTRSRFHFRRWYNEFAWHGSPRRSRPLVGERPVTGNSKLLPRGVASDPEHVISARKKKKGIAEQILLTGSDVLSLTGVALLLSAIIQNATLPLYHLHIIYDTASFVFISNTAAIACSFTPSMDYRYARYTVICIFALLYLVYIILFGVRLRSWNPALKGRCFDTSLTATRSASHPSVDYAYLVVTCFYAFWSLSYAFLLHRDEGDHGIGVEVEASRTRSNETSSGTEAQTEAQLRRVSTRVVKRMEKRRDGTEKGVLFVAFFQYPLHVWSVFALRAANNDLLTSGIEEQVWGFGQIFAIVALGSNVVALCNGIGEYQTWKRKFIRDRKEDAAGARGESGSGSGSRNGTGHTQENIAGDKYGGIPLVQATSSRVQVAENHGIETTNQIPRI